MATRKKPAAKKGASARPGARRQPETLPCATSHPRSPRPISPTKHAFYRDVLGFVVGEEWRENGTLEAARMLAGSVKVSTSIRTISPWVGRTKGIGSRLRCTTRKTSTGSPLRSRHAAARSTRNRMDMPWGERQFMITDPDGFKLTFVQTR